MQILANASYILSTAQTLATCFGDTLKSYPHVDTLFDTARALSANFNTRYGDLFQRFANDISGGAKENFAFCAGLLVMVTGGKYDPFMSEAMAQAAPQAMAPVANSTDEIGGLLRRIADKKVPPATTAQKKAAQPHVITQEIVGTCHTVSDNAGKNPSTTAMRMGEDLVPIYKDANQLFQIMAHQNNADVPSYIDDVLLAGVAQIESDHGRRIFTKNNSYIGVFGLSPTLELSHLHHYKERIAGQLEGLRKSGIRGLGILEQCKDEIVGDTIVRGEFFQDAKLQGFAVLSMMVEFDKQLKKFDTYNTLMPAERRAVLYLMHNLMAIAKYSVSEDHFKSEKPLAEMLGAHPMKDKLLKLMGNNPSVYMKVGRDEISNVLVTIPNIIENVVGMMKKGEDFAANSKPSANDSDLVTKFLSRVNPEPKQPAAALRR